jgi:hypothetical protein
VPGRDPAPATYQRDPTLAWAFCPACRGIVIDFLEWKRDDVNVGKMIAAIVAHRDNLEVVKATRVFPPRAVRRPPAPEVPEAVRRDYVEATLVVEVSSRAAGVLLRRCLQACVEDIGFTGRDLRAQLNAVFGDPRTPSTLGELLHAVRAIGNLCAHPTPTRAGILLEPEPGEIDLLFETLDHFFDTYYVKPTRTARAKATLNQKLAQAGKPPV